MSDIIFATHVAKLVSFGIYCTLSLPIFKKYLISLYIEIRLVICNEFKLGNGTTPKSHNINRLYREATIKQRTLQLSFQKFRSGDELLQNEP